MSRKNARLLRLTDLQGKNPDYILTKGDCDLICDALLKYNDWKKTRTLFYAFKNPTRL